jgi:hypothetical protein
MNGRPFHSGLVSLAATVPAAQQLLPSKAEERPHQPLSSDTLYMKHPAGNAWALNSPRGAAVDAAQSRLSKGVYQKRAGASQK